MPFSQLIDVRFADLDALGHVNHAVCLSYLEHARTQWWRGYLGERPFLDEGFVVARAEVDYRQPIHFGDQVRVDLTCSHVGRTSLTTDYRMVRAADQTLLLEARTVLVMVDMATGRPRPLSAQAKAWLRDQA